jgi:aspartate 1-decarboxylase
MIRFLLRSKIHRATVTDARLDYVGSITIDRDLMDAADVTPYEKVLVVDVDNGARLETYAIGGPRGSGVVCMNGAAARLVSPGDKVIVMTFCGLDERETQQHRPRVVFVDDANRQVGLADEDPEPDAELPGGLV